MARIIVRELHVENVTRVGLDFVAVVVLEYLSHFAEL